MAVERICQKKKVATAEKAEAKIDDLGKLVLSLSVINADISEITVE